MRVRLKGINSKTVTLASGRTATYWYAWKGGPRLPGKPGSAEFVAAYNEAVARRKMPNAGILFAVLQGYQASQDFASLAPRSRADYVKQIKKIEAEFLDLPLAALSDRRMRGEFLAWRDRLAVASQRQADYAYSVLARILSWALDRGLIPTNPCTKAGRLYRATRAENVWTDADEDAFMAKAPKHLHLALQMALWTGQRQGDLLRLTWSTYDGKTIRLRQGKTGVRVVIPVAVPLKAMLEAAKGRGTHILTTAEGRPWTEDGFRSSWAKAAAKAGIDHVTFHDLRGTAVTRLAQGATEAEIATLTGHSLKDVRSILDSHYLARDPALAVSAIRKLEGRTKMPEQAPEGAVCSHDEKEKSA